MARSSSICLLAKVARRRRPAEAQRTRSLGLGYKVYAVVPVAGKRTHGTTFRELKVTFRVATPGAESAVYHCLVVVIIIIIIKSPNHSVLRLILGHPRKWPVST